MPRLPGFLANPDRNAVRIQRACHHANRQALAVTGQPTRPPNTSEWADYGGWISTAAARDARESRLIQGLAPNNPFSGTFPAPGSRVPITYEAARSRPDQPKAQPSRGRVPPTAALGHHIDDDHFLARRPP